MEPEQYSLEEIEEKLRNGELPFSGITELGSSEFHFEAPAFHALLEMVCRYLLQQHKYALLFDMHANCYQREKKQTWQKDERPEINIGTGAVNREIFEPAITCFKSNLRRTRIHDHPLGISGNEIFFGGYLSRHLSRIFNERLLVLALEYKKIFMNEWTGELYPDLLDKLILDFNRAVDKAVETCLLHLR